VCESAEAVLMYGEFLYLLIRALKMGHVSSQNFPGFDF